MGPDQQTTSDIEADAFFARFDNVSIDVIADVWADKGGDLAAVTAEDREFRYWARKMADRAERRAQQDLAAVRARQARQDRIDDIAALVPAAPIPTDGQPPVVLPTARVVVLTNEERAETVAWWRRLANNQGAFTLKNRIRREIRTAEEEDRFAARANAAWQLEQRAFERAQWLAVTRVGQRRRKVANHWVAISEDRALEIALAALAKQHPPQGRK